MEDRISTILVIDDNEDNIISFKALINDAFPYAIFCAATSGKRGLELAVSELPDIIILDIIMPEMDGYEVCTRLKASHLTKHIPILMLTAIKTDTESRVKGLTLGADAFLSKPIDYAELKAQLSVMLRMKVAEDRLRAENEMLEKIVSERTHKLKESEEKYKALYEKAPLPYQSLNDDGSFRDVNPAWLSTLGYERDEVIGKFYEDFLHPKWKEHFKKNFPAFKKRGYVHNVEYKIKHKSGHYLHIMFEGCVGFNPDGSFRQTYCVFQDVTEQKRAEELLRENERKLSTLIGNLPGMVYRCANDKNWTMEYVSGGSFELTGYLPRELVNNTVISFNDIIHINDRENLYNKWQDILSRKETFQGEYRIIAKSGEEKWVWEQGCGVYSDTNEVIALEGIIIDITESKQAEEDLQQSYSFNETLLKTIPFGMDIVDENGIILFQSDNFKKLFGESAIEKHCWELYRDDCKQCPECPLLKGIVIGETQVYETDGVLGGKTYEILHTGMMFKGKKAMLEIFQDITERKKSEQELIQAKVRAEESDRLKTAFLHNISHEIRTPMNAIVGFSGLLTNPDILPEKRENFTDIIVQSSNQLLSIITDIVNIATIEAGQEKVVETVVNLKATFELIYEQFRFQAEKQKISLQHTLFLPDEDLFIKTDETKLNQVLINLVGNALKFTKLGHVCFGYTINNDELEFTVEDTGIGIPDDMNEEIFNRFSQVESTTVRQFSGSGLGLSISKAYVELMGGRMWFNSEVDKGSTFYFTIPYKRVQKKEILAENDKEIKIDTKQVKTLLIVEDITSNYLLLEAQLSRLNISALRAKNGLEAIEICKSIQYIDLILMDIKMPIMDGYEATKKIREFMPDIPIIILTAHNSDSDKNKAMASGCNELMTKPLDWNILKPKIIALLYK